MGAPPPPGSWNPAWVEALALVALSAAYLWGVRRTGGASPARVAASGACVLVLLALFVTPAHTLSVHYLLSAHLVQNVALAEWAPLLAVLGITPAMGTALARHGPVRVLTHPLVALPLWVVNYIAWHVPAIYDAALRNHALLHVEHLAYFVTGLLLWWPVFQEEPHRLSNGLRAAYVFAAFLLASPIGLLLALLPEPIYAFYEEAPPIWGLDPLTDQQIAGILMAGSEAIVFFGVFMLLVWRWFADEGAT
jgi:cytochrome c oxidase assembly factor CtaG